jgi:nucleotide-binding universal stress UspA family protein
MGTGMGIGMGTGSTGPMRHPGAAFRSAAAVFEPLRTVVVGADFTPAAEHALTRVAQLPMASSSRLLLLHALSPDLAEAELPSQQDETLRRLEELAAGVRAQGYWDRGAVPTLDLVATQGLPAEELIRHARAASADLIVLGRHDSTRLRERLRRRTWEAVLRRSGLPLLVVAGAPGGPYRRPMVALDLNAGCHDNLDLALRLAGRDVEEVIVTHAYSVPFETWLRDKDFVSFFQQGAADKLDRVLRAYAPLGIPFTSVIRKGAPEPALLFEMLDGHADLVVTGHSGRTRLVRALLGSLAEWAAHELPCDVLVGRPRRFSYELP